MAQADLHQLIPQLPLPRTIADLGPLSATLAQSLGLPAGLLADLPLLQPAMRVLTDVMTTPKVQADEAGPFDLASLRCYGLAAGRYLLAPRVPEAAMTLRNVAAWPVGATIVRQSRRGLRWTAPLRPTGLLRTMDLAADSPGEPYLTLPLEAVGDARASVMLSAKYWLQITRMPDAEWDGSVWPVARVRVFARKAAQVSAEVQVAAKLESALQPDSPLRDALPKLLAEAGPMANLLQLQLPDAATAARQMEDAVAHELRFGLAAAWRRASDSTSLLDATFVLSPQTQPLFRRAIDGQWNSLLVRANPGITLHQCLLHEESVRRQTLQISLPWLRRKTESETKVKALRAAVERNGAHLYFTEIDGQSERKESRNGDTRISRLTLHLFSGVLSDQPLPPEAACTYTLSGLRPNVFAADANLLDILQQTYGGALQLLQEERGVGCTVTLPAWAVEAWRNAPEEKQHPAYLAASRRLQRTLRAVVPAMALAKARQQGRNLYPDASLFDPALRLWCNLPVTTGIARKGNTLLLNQSNELYWDWMSPVLLQSLAAASGLSVQVQQEALRSVYRANLRSLLFTEATLIEKATGVGRKLAKARSEEARSGELQRAISDLLDTFHRTLSSLYGDLRPFTPLLLAAAAPSTYEAERSR